MAKKKLVTRTASGKETKGGDWRTAEMESGKTRQKRNSASKAASKRASSRSKKIISKM